MLEYCQHSVALANKFNTYYIDKIDKLRESIPPSTEEEIPWLSNYEGVKLEMFALTNAEEVREILTDYGIKTSCEDPLPVSVLKQVIHETIPVLVKLVNKSLRINGRYKELSDRPTSEKV